MTERRSLGTNEDKANATTDIMHAIKPSTAPRNKTKRKIKAKANSTPPPPSEELQICTRSKVPPNCGSNRRTQSAGAATHATQIVETSAADEIDKSLAKHMFLKHNRHPDLWANRGASEDAPNLDHKKQEVKWEDLMGCIRAAT